MFETFNFMPPHRRVGAAVALVILLSIHSTAGAEQLFGDTFHPESAMTANRLGQQIGEQLSNTELLGPLAPVALSPFFGITLLSGIAIFGEGWVGQENALLHAAGPLKNPLVFCIFLMLTILTSIPRFSKVSKPFAQAVDKIEAVSGIITLLLIYFLSQSGNEPAPIVYRAGIFSLTAQSLLSIAMVINILAINSIKFFFEMLIWITPVPLLDAAFEIANKSLCAAMMAVYAYSPTLATIINLTLFAVCAMLFVWARRREIYYRTLMFDALRCWWGGPAKNPVIVLFPNDDIGAIPAKSRCELERTEDGWCLRYRRWLRPPAEWMIGRPTSLELSKGWFTTKFAFSGDSSLVLTGSRRYHADLENLARELNATIREEEPILSFRGLRQEMA